MRSVVRIYPGPPKDDAGWSSPVARWAHNPKVAGSNPAPATNFEIAVSDLEVLVRGCSSVGRAHGLQPWGQGFESPHLHQKLLKRSARLERLIGRIKLIGPIER